MFKYKKSIRVKLKTIRLLLTTFKHFKEKSHQLFGKLAT